LDFTETRESGFLRFCLPENQNPTVGAAEGCDLLILLVIAQKQDQKIAAFGSSYMNAEPLARRT